MMTKIQNIYAYITKNNRTVSQLKDDIISSINNSKDNYDTWKVIKNIDKKNYLQNINQLKNSWIDLVPAKDNTKLFVYVLKNSTEVKDDQSVASLLISRFIATMLYHFSDIQIITIRKK
jgi:hypothetical protein